MSRRETKKLSQKENHQQIDSQSLDSGQEKNHNFAHVLDAVFAINGRGRASIGSKQQAVSDKRRTEEMQSRSISS
jgi:hypothetical protein